MDLGRVMRTALEKPRAEIVAPGATFHLDPRPHFRFQRALRCPQPGRPSGRGLRTQEQDARDTGPSPLHGWGSCGLVLQVGKRQRVIMSPEESAVLSKGRSFRGESN